MAKVLLVATTVAVAASVLASENDLRRTRRFFASERRYH